MSLKGLLFGSQKFEETKESFKSAIASFKEEVGLDRPANTLVEASQFANVLIVKSRSYSLGSIFSCSQEDVHSIDNEFFQIVTTNGEKIYSAKMEPDILTNRDLFSVYDTRFDKRKIGEIKQWLISMRMPIFEKEAKTCSVLLGKEKIGVLKKCVSFGKTEFQTIEGNISVRFESENDFSILYHEKEIAKSHAIPLKLKNSFVDRYVLEYPDLRDEQVALMVTLAIDCITT